MEKYKSKLIIVLFTIISIISLVSLARTTVLLWNSYLPDFRINYESSQRLLKHENPYDNKTLFSQVNYPPITLFVLSPLTFLSPSTASQVWLVFSILCLFGTVFILNKITQVSLLTNSIIILATSFSFPFKFTLGMGQINLVTVLFLALFIFYFSRKVMLSGFFVSVAILVKIFPAILFLPLLAQKKVRVVAVTFFFLCLVEGISIIIFGYERNLYYITQVLIPIFQRSFGEVYYNQSITGVVARLHLPTFIALILRLLILGFTVFWIKKRNYAIMSLVALSITTAILIGSYSWQHYFVFLIIPFFSLLSKKQEIRVYFTLIVAYILIAINIKNPEYFATSIVGNIVLSHGFLGAFIMWLLLIKNNHYETT